MMDGNERLNNVLSMEGEEQFPAPSTEECSVALMWCTVKEFRRIARFPVTEKTIIRWLKDGLLKCEFRLNKGKRGNLIYEIMLIDKKDQEKLQHIRESKSQHQKDRSAKRKYRRININSEFEIIEALLSNKEIKPQLSDFIVRAKLTIPKKRKLNIKAWVPFAVYDKLSAAAKDSKRTISEIFEAYVLQFMKTPPEWELAKMAMKITPPSPDESPCFTEPKLS